MKRMLLMLLLVGTVFGQTTLPKREPIKFHSEAINCLGELSRIWDYNQDGWDDMWVMQFPQIKHRNKTTDTDADGTSDYDEMLLSRNPITPGPKPRKLSEAEKEANAIAYEKFKKENHEKNLILWAQAREARKPYTRTGNTQEKFWNAKLEKQLKFNENAKTNPVFDELLNAGKSQAQINLANATFTLSPSGHNLNGAGRRIAQMEDTLPAGHSDVTSNRMDTGFGASPAFSNHALAVAGIIKGTGARDARGIGIVLGVTLDSYQINTTWSLQDRLNQITENDTYVSNHSYGPYVGWTGFYQNLNGQGLYPTWEGNLNVTKDEPNYAGQYRATVEAMDEVMDLKPKHLMVIAAGNERRTPHRQFPPSTAGDTSKKFYYRDAATAWQLKTLSVGESEPKSAGDNNNGHDSLTPLGVSKNAIVVGSHDTLNGIAQFASTGPTDDGRMKPDIIAHGHRVWAPFQGEGSPQSQYSDLWTGCSFAAPVVASAAALIGQAHEPGNPGIPFFASTVKAILMHTADSHGPVGFDYNSGAGIVNVDRAIQVVKANDLLEVNPFIKEFVIEPGQVSRIKVKVAADAVPSLKATLAWTDDKGTVFPGLNSTFDVLNKQLKNDLDLSIIPPTGIANVVRPWKLDPFNPTAAATRGINELDNVEQVVVDNPTVGGIYEIVVDATKLGVGVNQSVSLIFTNVDPTFEDGKAIKVSSLDRVGEDLYSIGWVSVAGRSYTVQESDELGVWSDVVADIQAIGDTTFFEVQSNNPTKKFWRVKED